MIDDTSTGTESAPEFDSCSTKEGLYLVSDCALCSIDLCPSFQRSRRACALKAGRSLIVESLVEPVTGLPELSNTNIVPDMAYARLRV